jgi:hypothetical protein
VPELHAKGLDLLHVHALSSPFAVSVKVVEELA